MSDVFHITTRPLWEAAAASGEYRGETFETEGFIHASDESQVIATANRFYRGVDDLIVLRIETDRLRSRLIWEKATDVDELFPHIFGPIHVNAVIEVIPLVAEAAGEFRSLPV